MTPKYIKSQSTVFGKITLYVESAHYFDSFWISIDQFALNRLDEQECNQKLQVHNWELDWEDEIEERWYGKLDIHISSIFLVEEANALYAANAAINELNVSVDTIRVGKYEVKVNDFIIEWTCIYYE